MSKIFETSFENGSLIEKISNQQGTIFNSPKFIQLNKGLSLALNTNKYVSFPNIITFNPLKPFSIVANIFPSNIGVNTNTIFNLFFNNTNYLVVYITDSKIQLEYFYNSSTSININTTSSIKLGNKLNSIYIIYNGILNLNGFSFYLNNNKLTTQLNSSNLVNGFISGIVKLGVYRTSQFFFNGKIYKVKLYNHLLSQKEINQEYVDFLNAKPINKPIVFQPNLNILKPTEVKE